MRCYLAFAVFALFVIAASAGTSEAEEGPDQIHSEIGALQGSRRALNCHGSHCSKPFYYSPTKKVFFKCGTVHFGYSFPCFRPSTPTFHGFKFVTHKPRYFKFYKFLH